MKSSIRVLAVGATLKPKAFCVGELADQGAGHPDFGLYTAKQVQRGQLRQGQTPERGVVGSEGGRRQPLLRSLYRGRRP